MFGKINENTLKKAKNKLDVMLSEKQKQEIFKKLENTDRATLLKMLENVDLSSVSDSSIENLLNNFDADSIIDKIKKM